MKSKILNIISALALLATAAACDDNYVPDLVGKGEIKLGSLAVEVKSGETEVNRGEGRAVVDISNFLVKIEDSEGTVVAKWTYSQMPELFALPVASYKVVVESHEIQKAEWNAPYYYGDKEFEIQKDAITDLGTVTCTFKSLKVTVVFSEALRKIMADDVKVVVKANDEGELTYTPEETRSGFFACIPGSQSLVAEFSGTIKGNAEYIRKAYTDVEAGQHLTLTFDVRDNSAVAPDEFGTIDSPANGISVNLTYGEDDVIGGVKEEDQTIDASDRPGYEEPVEPDPGTDPGTDPTPASDITFKSSTLSFTGANDPNSDELQASAVVNIHADAKVAHLFVHIESDSDAFNASAGALLPFDFDLAYPGSYEEAYAGLGFPVGNGFDNGQFAVGPVLGQTDLNFDITQFVPLLGSFSGTHKFTITVEDEGGAKKSVTLTFKA